MAASDRHSLRRSFRTPKIIRLLYQTFWFRWSTWAIIVSSSTSLLELFKCIAVDGNRWRVLDPKATVNGRGDLGLVSAAKFQGLLETIKSAVAGLYIGEGLCWKEECSRLTYRLWLGTETQLHGSEGEPKDSRATGIMRSGALIADFTWQIPRSLGLSYSFAVATLTKLPFSTS